MQMMRIVTAAMLAMPIMPAIAAEAGGPVDDVAAIKATLDAGCAGFVAKDKIAAMSPMLNSPELKVFDFTPPRAKNWQKLYKDNADFADMVDGKATCEYLETHPTLLSKDAAYSWSIMRFAAKFKDGRTIDVTFRETDVWRKIGGRWYSVHEHNSFPVDVFTGQADLQSKP